MMTKLRQIILGFAVLFSALSTVQAEPKVGDKFGNWLFECQALAANKTACALSQTLVQSENQQRVLRVSLNKLESNDEVQLVAIAPLGIYLPFGVTGKVDDELSIPLELQACAQQGCIATTTLKGKFLKALKSGGSLKISFSGSSKSEPVVLNLSLDGITAGIDALSL